ncbi:MAG: histidine kinase [Flavobacteriaceae bacterium]|nr:histidine kinase [Flavobacteriaceae bacterium]
MKKYSKVALHILVWTIGYIAILKNVNTIGDFRKETGPFWVPVLFGTLMNSTIYYSVVYFVFPDFFRHKKIQTLLLWLFVGFVAVNLFESFVDHRWLVSHFSTEKEPFASFLFYNTMNSFFILLIALTVSLITNWIQSEKQKRILLEEKLTTEMAFLKSQINPHFLFNVLNSFYAKSLKHNVPELADGISKLAELMRYMVYETNENKVALKKEIHHLKKFIEVAQLRIAEEDDVIINVSVHGDISQVEISPMLLIPFVENAIKHGIDIKTTSIIDINVTVDDHQLVFKVVNGIQQKMQEGIDEHSGFGLENLKRRLAILYPKLHTIETKEEAGKFISLLTLQLD